MAEFLQSLQPVLAGAIYVAIGLLCVAGLALSLLTLSGTWLVALAAVLAMPIPGKSFPGIGTVALFFLICAAVEGVEAVAGALGVRKRGGSALAGVLAIAGGLIGLVLGTFIPIPVFGSILGMLAGSFVLVYLAEKQRLKHSRHAAHIAWGTVIGRIFVLFVKVTATLGLAVALWAGLLRG